MLHCYFNNGRYIVIKNYLTLFHFCYEINEFSYSVLYCISLHELISLQELKCYIEHECVVLMRGCLEYLRRSLFSRGGIRLEQTVIFLRNVMIFLKVPVGIRKTATLTMKKTVRVVQWWLYNIQISNTAVPLWHPSGIFVEQNHGYHLRQFLQIFQPIDHAYVTK